MISKQNIHPCLFIIVVIYMLSIKLLKLIINCVTLIAKVMRPSSWWTGTGWIVIRQRGLILG